MAKKEPKAKKEVAEGEEKAPMDKKLKIIIALVLVLILVALGVIAFLLLNNGNGSSGLNISQILGKWTLEVVSNEDIGMLSVGPAYLGYSDFFGEKNDASIRFNEDGTFVLTGMPLEYTGTYIVDEDNSSKKSIITLMTFYDAEEVKDYTEIYAIYAIRKSTDSGDTLSLTFSYLNDVYSFIK